MAKQKLTQVTVQGLATNPNPNALPAGSCAQAQNIVMRRPGIISPMPAFISKGTIPAAEDVQKLLFSDFSNQVLAVSEVGLTPITLPSTIGSEITQLPKDTTGGERDLVLNPPQTQTAFSHFRSFITERSGVITNLERWAGLPPPAAVYCLAHASADGFLLDGNSVAYRCHFSLESTDSSSPYIVDGPVSAIGALFNDSGSTCGVDLLIYAPPNEPFVIPTNCKLYCNIYRSTQATVEFVTELADDFRKVAQVEITDFTPTFTPLFEDLVADNARANGDPLYTNNTGQGEPSNWAPPAATDICVFKDTTFYANKSSLPVLTVTIPGPFGVLLSNREREIGIGRRDVASATITLDSPDIVFTNADDVIGVVPGQLLSMSGFDDPTTVVSVVGTTVTVSTDSAVSDTNREGSFYDMIKVIVAYPDETTTTQTARVIFFDFDAVAAGTLPGFRMLHPAVDTERVEEGIKLQLIYTWNAIGILEDGFAVCLTNGQNYYPAYSGDYVAATDPLQALLDIRPNRVFYSKTGLPEAAPVANFFDVGAGTIQKMWANQSALFFFCTDGLWKITGDGTTFAVYQIDPTVYLIAPDAVTSLNNLIYAWVTDGIATITEDGATTISTDAVGPLLRRAHNLAVSGPTEPVLISLVGDSFRNEVWLLANKSSEVPEASFALCVLYNDDTKNFSANSAFGQSEGGGALPAGSVYAPNVSRTAFFEVNGGSRLLLPADYDEINDDQLYLPMTGWLNPNQTEDKGNLKQWMDLNYFTANYAPSLGPTAASNWIKATFDARAEMTDPTAADVNVNDFDNELKRDVHFLVPRRTALSDQQQIGFRTFTLDDEGVETGLGPYVEIQGFTMRYRIASDTLKR